MANGKVRSASHLIDQDAILIVRQKLPREWVIRELSPDYGLDLDVELFVKEEGRIVTLGEHLYMQVKGTTCAKYRDIVIGKNEYQMLKRCLVFQLDTALLRLVERVGDSLPILLVIVDIETHGVYFVCLNDYVNFTLSADDTWREQDTKVIYVPCDNCIESTHILRWYALRPKLNAFFAQVSNVVDDLKYVASAEDYIQKVKGFASRNRESDVWNCIDLGFLFMKQPHELLQCMIDETTCPEVENVFKDFSNDDLISSGRFENMTVDTAKSLFMARQFIDSVSSANSIFSSCIRQLFVNTEYEAIVST